MRTKTSFFLRRCPADVHRTFRHLARIVTKLFSINESTAVNKTLLNRFRQTLEKHRDVLNTRLETESGPVILGTAQKCDIENAIAKHDEAIQKIDNGKFGDCSLCAGSVEPERLELDFTTEVCLDHFSEADKRGLERDLELAAKVQRQLLPHAVPILPGLQIDVFTEPARVVGGDYFDFFVYRDGRQGIMVADVMGKGLPASMLMSNLQASLRILGPEYDQLPLLCGRLNELFQFNLKLINFISLMLLGIDARTGMVQYTNAGHHPALWWRDDDRTVRWLNPTGPAVGLTPNPGFGTQELQLSPGDVLVCYTDGIVEARNRDGKEFGEERLTEYVRQHHAKPVKSLVQGLVTEARTFAGGFHDDITLLAIKAE